MAKVPFHFEAKLSNERHRLYLCQHGIILLAGALFTLVQLLVLVPAGDNVFLLDISGWMLDGGRYFYEFMELNPPLFPVLMFPVQLAHRLTGLGVHPLFIVWISILIASSSAVVFRELTKVVDDGSASCVWLAIGVEAVLFFVPQLDFGQRDHLGVVLLLPALAGLAAREPETPTTRRDWFIAVMGAFGLLMKPHLLILGCSVYAMRLAQERNWRVLIEAPVLAGLVVSCLYVGAILIFFPEWLLVAKMASLVYSTFDTANGWFTNRTFVSVVAILGLAALNQLLATGKERSLGHLLAAAAAGALASYVLQHKDFEYHFVPTKVLLYLLAGLVAMSVMKMGATIAASQRLHGWAQMVQRYRCPILSVFALLFLSITVNRTNINAQSEAVDEWRLVQFLQLNNAGQRIASFSTALWPAYPLPAYRTSMPAWRWAQPWPIAWIALQEREGRASEANTVQMSRDLREMVKEDFRRFDPDALLVDESAGMQAITGKFEMLEWFRRDPELARILDEFERVGELHSPHRKYVGADLALYKRRSRESR